MRRSLAGAIVLSVVLAGISVTDAAGAPADRAPAFGRSLAYYTQQLGRVLWVDATANLDRIGTREGITDIVSRSARAGITTIVIDVKPVSGHVMYPSKVAARLTEWRGKPVADLDVLQTFIDEAHRAGIEVAASINTFSEGHKYFSVGLGYARPEWQMTALVVHRYIAAADGSRLTIRAPGDPEESDKPLVLGADAVIETSPTQGQSLVVALDHDGQVAGMIDPALLGDEPLCAPEEGRLLEVRGRDLEWATSHLKAGDRSAFRAESRLARIADAPSERIAVFVNPLHPEARAHVLAIVREIAGRYPIDALVFDRMRHASLSTDFSPITKRAFERWLGRTVAKWPDDVISIDPTPGEPFQRGRLFRPWLEFRAKVIHDFLREASEIVRSVRPEARVAAYVGSWFSEYYPVGVNWASEKYPVRTSWASRGYQEAGYLEMLDWLSTGCYYGVPTREMARRQGRSEGATVESAAEVSVRVTANSAPVYAGLYALNYKDRPQDFEAAIDTAVRRSYGVMLFDASHIFDYGWWPILERAFASPVVPPHAARDTIAQLRAAQDAVVAVAQMDSAVTRMPSVPPLPGGG